MATEVEVVIYDSVITAFSLPGGIVWRYGYQKAQRTERVARGNIKSRSGYLAAHTHARYEGSRRDQAIMVVESEADYAVYVHEGTHGPIMSTNHRFLRLSPGGGYGVVYARQVAGQRANPYLRDALEEVMATV